MIEQGDCLRGFERCYAVLYRCRDFERRWAVLRHCETPVAVTSRKSINGVLSFSHGQHSLAQTLADRTTPDHFDFLQSCMLLHFAVHLLHIPFLNYQHVLLKYQCQIEVKEPILTRSLYLFVCEADGPVKIAPDRISLPLQLPLQATLYLSVLTIVPFLV
jgi:hypothetical protein